MAALRILVVGANGRMGREVVRGVLADAEMHLVGAVDLGGVGEDAGTLAGVGACGTVVTAELDQTLEAARADAVIDFTSPKVVMRNIRTCLTRHAPVVVGTTGITAEDVDEVRKWSSAALTNVIIAPNFTIGAVLMMLFAKTASKYFSNAEIVELHHNNKVDAPSGTAIKTAEMMLEARQGQPSPPEGEFEKLQGARGGALGGIRVHSIRLPGFMAHQEVIFGDAGQTLTIRHDSTSRECYVPGVLMAVRRLGSIHGVVYGLENLL